MALAGVAARELREVRRDGVRDGVFLFGAGKAPRPSPPAEIPGVPGNFSGTSGELLLELRAVRKSSSLTSSSDDMTERLSMPGAADVCQVRSVAVESKLSVSSSSSSAEDSSAGRVRSSH